MVEGINIGEVMKYSEYFDVNRFETNSIWETFDHYGIEAARGAIIREINAVLSAYGLDVSYRHFGLLSDYMCQLGRIRGLNRMAMAT
eukprot:UN19967